MSGEFEQIDDGWSEDKYVALAAAKKLCEEMESEPMSAEPKSVAGEIIAGLEEFRDDLAAGRPIKMTRIIRCPRCKAAQRIILGEVRPKCSECGRDEFPRPFNLPSDID